MMAAYIMGALAFIMLGCATFKEEERGEYLVAAAGSVVFALFLAWLK